ncbi:hypothetical protein [Rhizobium leguminosarum]|uniref:hypothetical protein n=1 Tax=Rhizobium leguminosarum TaxID=384 RepID=UPI001AE80E96|nr:hypothetical protein [Rhizobium leguminosarum]MBP2444140.1 hypothetical protein [Rhizobium leguminosarum]
MAARRNGGAGESGVVYVSQIDGDHIGGALQMLDDEMSGELSTTCSSRARSSNSPQCPGRRRLEHSGTTPSSETVSGLTVGGRNLDWVSQADRASARTNVNPFTELDTANPSSALGPGFASHGPESEHQTDSIADFSMP